MSFTISPVDPPALELLPKVPGTTCNTVGVTFRRESYSAESVTLVADFNDWSTTATPMELVGDLFEVTVPLERGRSYRYKFLVDGERWENDLVADDYVANEYGGHDSLRML